MICKRFAKRKNVEDLHYLVPEKKYYENVCSTKTFLISTTTETSDGREDIYREVEGACNVVIYSIAKKGNVMKRIQG